jgi:hypothetical protein
MATNRWTSLAWPIAMVLIALIAAVTFLKGFGKVEEIAKEFLPREIKTTFEEHLAAVRASDGNILQVGVVESTEILRREDTMKLFGDLFEVGTTVTEIRIPAIYKFEINIDEQWDITSEISEQNSVLTIIAPNIKPSLPVAFDSERMEKFVQEDMLRFNAEEQMLALEKEITPTLNRLAPGKIDLVRDKARMAVAKFAQNWLLREQQWDREKFSVIAVYFQDEFGSIGEMQRQREPLVPTLRLQEK